MTLSFRSTLFSSLSSLGLLVIASPAFAQAPAAAAPAAPATATAPAEPVAAPVAEAPVEAIPVAEPAPVPAEPAPVVEAAPPAPAPLAEVPAPLAPAPVEEEPSLSPLKIGTSSFSRFEYRENYDKLGVSRPRFAEGDMTVFRSRLTFQTAELKLGGTLKGSMYFAPQASGSWGSSGLGGTIGEANLGIYEGYFKLAGDSLAFKAGRFAMNYGDAFVIGNLDWHQSGRAFDGAHLSAKLGKSTIDTFVTQTAEGGQAGPFMAGDALFWGAYGMFGPSIAKGMDLDVYALAKTWGASNVTTTDAMGVATTAHKDAATFVTIGARAKRNYGVFDYRLDAGFQVGKTQAAVAGDSLKKMAYQGDLELGLSPVEAFRIAVGGLIASGNKADTADKDEAYDELYPTTHKWLGLMDVIGLRTNVVSANLKLALKMGDTLTANLDGHLFMRPEGGGLGRFDEDTMTAGVQNDTKMAGYEVNAGLAKKLGKFALVRGLYGIFIPTDGHYASNSAAHFVEVEAGLRF